MPQGNSLNDDDYVISLLTKDAEANKKRYLTSGLGSLLSKRRSENAPKPNTSFLKNVIKDVDAHNSALKAKEEEDAAARLKELKRKREDRGQTHRVEKRMRGEEQEGRWARAFGGLGERSGQSSRQAADRRLDKSRHDRQRSKNRSRSPDRDRGENRSGPSERSSRRHRREDREKRHRRDRKRSRSRSPQEQPFHNEDSASGNESDALDDVIGPRPAPKIQPRGRGAYKDTTSMDTKFKPNYNPKTDVDLSPDDGERDGWDMALEALRDRAKWRVSGGDRLRRAGFSEADVKKWEGESGLLGQDEVKREKDVEDVRWRKRGEAREWDQGKTLGKDGAVELRASWA